eukprot:Protomagalhaensia_wolfi_Nauph_80__481@NODE_126_length_3546_cov_41_445680_g96_i0_p1_GENE_NODE_126_length_3546_cov_41_445680_g96_i0NODE_126_length_3546_cov_41_445680_g96_i0_p1_ORF_typecomplete_len405_score11_40Acyl_transf_3/PF01757_22/2_9e07_NODE_126_length_3546_cov_41_445680_g96_i0551269
MSVRAQGLTALRCMAVASVYAAHYHLAFNGMRWLLASNAAVDHFFLWSGMLAYPTLRRMFRQPSRTHFLPKRIITVWLSFCFRRLGPLWLFIHLQYMALTIWSPAFEASGPYCPYRVSALWNQTWDRPHPCNFRGNAPLWFLSLLSLFWVCTPPLVAVLIQLPDLCIMALALTCFIWNAIAIRWFPLRIPFELRMRYYYAPQSHWQQYLLGVVVWAARTSPTGCKWVALASRMVQKSRLAVLACGLVSDAYAVFFVWLMYQVTHHPSRKGNLLADPLYRTNHHMALVVLLWSTPLVRTSLIFRFANSPLWDKLDPDGFSMCFWMNQRPLGSFLTHPYKAGRGRVFIAFTITVFSVITNRYVAFYCRRLVDVSCAHYESVMLPRSSSHDKIKPIKGQQKDFKLKH